jgi:hypothetical protein
MWLLDRLARRFKSASTASAPEASAASGAEVDAAERRKHVRLNIGAPTMVLIPGLSEVRAFIRDISKGGCLLDTDAHVEVGSSVSLAFLSRPRGHCRAEGKVVRKASNGGLGVEFSRVNMAFLGFVSAASPEHRDELVAAMRGSTVRVEKGAGATPAPL